MAMGTLCGGLRGGLQLVVDSTEGVVMNRLCGLIRRKERVVAAVTDRTFVIITRQQSLRSRRATLPFEQ